MRGCNRPCSWPSADVGFRDALDIWPRPVARDLLIGCPAGTGSVAGGEATFIWEIDGACPCATCSCTGVRLAWSTSATLYHQSSFICSGAVGANEGSFTVQESSVVELFGMLTDWSMSGGELNIGECSL